MGHQAFARSDELVSDAPRATADAVSTRRPFSIAIDGVDAEELDARLDPEACQERDVAPRGRRLRSITDRRDGRHAGERFPRSLRSIDLALAATLRAAAPAQRQRSSASELAVVVEAEDLREKRRVRKIGRLLVFVVDLSGSMAERILAVARRAALLLLEDAYVKRDRVAMVGFRDVAADVLFAPTRSMEVARRCLFGLTTGGKTPLSRGLVCGHTLVTRAMRNDTRQEPVMVVISDGKANVGSRLGHGSVLAELARVAQGIRAERRLRTVFFDATEDGKDDSEAIRLAETLGAWRVRLHRLQGLDEPTLRSLFARL